MITGHIAVSLLLHHYLDAPSIPVLAGGLFPDVVDKTLAHGLDLTPFGRMYAHTLLGLGLTTAVVGQRWGGEAARGWGLGYLGHLLSDLNGFVPWLLPFVRYDFPQRKSGGIIQFLQRTLRPPNRLEAVLFLWAGLVITSSTRNRSQIPTDR